MVASLLPPPWLVHTAVSLVWLYEGLWCKLLKGDSRQYEIVKVVPRYGKKFGGKFIIALGTLEIFIAAWVMSDISSFYCALFQTALLVTLNINGLIWARHLIHDPYGMIIKNLSFILLAWVVASQPI